MWVVGLCAIAVANALLISGCGLVQKKQDTSVSDYAIQQNLNRPTKAEIENADCGPFPENYQKIVKDHLFQTLIDPNSLMIEFLGPPYKGYCERFTSKSQRFGYGVPYKINAKNRLGGYTGWQAHTAFIRGGEVWESQEDDGLVYGPHSDFVVPLDKVELQVETHSNQVQPR